MNKLRQLLHFVLLPLTIMIVACATPLSFSQTSASPTATNRTQTSSPSLTRLVGIYTTTITQQEIAAAHNPRISFQVQPGSWNFVLRSDGYYTLTTSSRPYGMSYVGEGTYTITGNQFISKDANCWEYFGNAGHFATYMWSLQGKQLQFTTAKDACLSRQFVFTLHPWLLQT